MGGFKGLGFRRSFERSFEGMDYGIRGESLQQCFGTGMLNGYYMGSSLN